MHLVNKEIIKLSLNQITVIKLLKNYKILIILRKTEKKGLKLNF